MQVHTPISALRFGALVPIKAAKAESPTGTEAMNMFGAIYTANDIEQEITEQTPNGQQLIRDLQALDSTLKTDDPVKFLVDFRNKKEPQGYLVTGKTDVETAKAKYNQALRNQLEAFIAKQKEINPLPHNEDVGIRLSTAKAQAEVLDELKKNITITAPACIVEHFSESATSMLYDKTFKITPYEA